MRTYQGPNLIAFMAAQAWLKPIEQDLIWQDGDVQHTRCLADRAADPQPGKSLAAHISQAQNWTSGVFRFGARGIGTNGWTWLWGERHGRPFERNQLLVNEAPCLNALQIAFLV